MSKKGKKSIDSPNRGAGGKVGMRSDPHATKIIYILEGADVR